MTSREEFTELAASYRAIPVYREILADLTTPVAAFLRCVGDDPGFLLESVENGDRWGRFSFIGRRPAASMIAHGQNIVIEGHLPDCDVPTDSGILAAVETVLEAYNAPTFEDLPPLTSGLVGYFGYDTIREIEHLPNQPADDHGYPDSVIDVIGEMAVFDHWRQQAILIAVALLPEGPSPSDIDEAYDDAVARLDNFAIDGATPLSEPMVSPPTLGSTPEGITESLSSEQYQRAVEVAKEYIVAGDIFQVVLSKRFEFELDADPFDVYRVLRQINPSPYMYFIRRPEITLVGSSPEPMVQVLQGRVISRPIAGTRGRGKTEHHDRKLAAELAEDPKERAEHVMLVDLARNDIGRVVDYGSMSIDEMMNLERYSHVMHLTSEVSGQLRSDKSVVDVLRASFPAGTVSGAPKVRAMEIIDELEPVKRGPYSGAVGYLDFSGNLDAAIAIRTMFCGPEVSAVQAGAGVVADSEPVLEDKECRNKASALLAAIEPARQMTATRRSSLKKGPATSRPVDESAETEK